MSPEQITAIMTGLATLIAAGVAGWIAIRGIKSQVKAEVAAVRTDLAVTTKAVNGAQKEMVEAKESLARAAGVIEGIAKEKADVALKESGRAEVLASVAEKVEQVRQIVNGEKGPAATKPQTGATP